MFHVRTQILRLLCAAVALCAACARSDAALQADSAAAIAANPATSGLDVTVNVRRRIVFLTGRTDTPKEQQHVLDVVQGVEGVELVVNDILLNDTDLRDRIQRALAAEPALAGTQIRVDAPGGGVARLESETTNLEQRQRAVEIASSVEGVTHVEDRMK